MQTARIIEKIELICKAQNIKKSALLRCAGLTSHLLADWKNGTTTPSIVALEKICLALNVSICDIFREEEHVFTLSQSKLLNEWKGLSACEKEAVELYLQALKSNLKS